MKIRKMKKRTGKKGLELIKRFEGFRSDAYICPAGILTIGYGHTEGVKAGDKVTYEQAEELLKQDVWAAENCVNDDIRVELTQNQFDALVSFVYNCGIIAFFYSTLRRVINRNPNDYEAIGREFARWNRAGGRVLQGLVNRRKAEFELYRLQ